MTNVITPGQEPRDPPISMCQETERVVEREAGADDHASRPFNLHEPPSRIRGDPVRLGPAARKGAAPSPLPPGTYRFVQRPLDTDRNEPAHWTGAAMPRVFGQVPVAAGAAQASRGDAVA